MLERRKLGAGQSERSALAAVNESATGESPSPGAPRRPLPDGEGLAIRSHFLWMYSLFLILGLTFNILSQNRRHETTILVKRVHFWLGNSH